MHTDSIRSTFQLASLLLQYPGDRFHHEAEDYFREWLDIQEEEGMGTLCRRTEAHFRSFLQALRLENKQAWADRYVKTFDFNKKSNMYLTYAELGEQRERGAVLLKLQQAYLDAGLLMADDELPDYLPLMLEFSCASYQEGCALLLQYEPAIQGIRDELNRMESPYTSVFDALLATLGQIRLSAGDAPPGGEQP
jgi:nitrate reductase molybdenum cofactor assembly chaperone NarJ/NarW